jgi:hypothetical protein
VKESFDHKMFRIAQEFKNIAKKIKGGSKRDPRFVLLIEPQDQTHNILQFQYHDVEKMMDLVMFFREEIKPKTTPMHVFLHDKIAGSSFGIMI